MADLHLRNLDEEVLTELRKQAQQRGLSLEETARSILQQETRNVVDASEEEASQTLRMPSSDRSLRNVDPVETSGIPASALLIRDRRR